MNMNLLAFSFVGILIIQTSSPAEILDSKNNLGVSQHVSTRVDLLVIITVYEKDVTKSIQNSVRRDSSRTLVCIVKETKIIIAKVEKKAKCLGILADKTLNEAERKVDASIAKQRDELATWCDEQQQKGNDVSDEKKTKIHLLITNLLKSFDDYSRSCSDKALQPIVSLHIQIQKTVEGSFTLMKSLSKKLDSCGRLNQRNQRAISKCTKEAKKQLKPIYALNGKYSKLTNQVKQVNLKKYECLPCVRYILDKIETLKLDVSKNIDNIVHDSPEIQEPDCCHDPKDDSEGSAEISKETNEGTAPKTGVKIELSEMYYRHLKASY